MLSDIERDGFIPGRPRPIPLAVLFPLLSSPPLRPNAVPLDETLALLPWPYAEDERPPPMPLDVEVAAGDMGDEAIVESREAITPDLFPGPIVYRTLIKGW